MTTGNQMTGNQTTSNQNIEEQKPEGIYVFLDDLREPSYLTTHSPQRDGDSKPWQVYRTAEALIEALPSILKQGKPVTFSLDHDLGEDILTGYDFVKMIVEMHIDGIYTLDDVYIRVHSANPIGAKNMTRLWENFEWTVLGRSMRERMP